MNKMQLLSSAKHTLSTNLNLPSLYAKKSYSQEGEDMVLMKMFDGKKEGFFVDVGAHHPFRYSNTYALYKQGWRGINIDATPGTMKAFDRVRHRDINLEMAVGTETKKSTMYIFEESALNTLSPAVARAVESSGQSKLVEKVEVETKTLASILADYLPKDTEVDLLNVDVEGADLQVLKSNDWRQFSPGVIIVEDIGDMTIEEINDRDIAQFLKKKSYRLRDKVGNSLIFVRR